MTLPAGVLPDHALRDLIAQGIISGTAPIAADQVQPASLDLRLGPWAARLRASFLAGRGRRISDALPDFEMHRMDLGAGAVLEKGCVYLLPLQESIALPLGMEAIAAHEASLRDYARTRLRALDWLTVQGDAPGKGAIFSMTMQGAHAHDISTILDKRGIAVRAGTHCAMPLMQFYGVTASARASFGLYNTKAEVDALIDGLIFCRELFA